MFPDMEDLKTTTKHGKIRPQQFAMVLRALPIV